MHRKRVRPHKDKKVFSRTASRSRKMNLSPKSARGGIRL